MKHLLRKKTWLLFLIAGCLYFTSCVDEKIDLNNLSTDISAGGSLAMPLGTADISIAKLLARYKPSGSSVSIGTSGDTITLLYQDSTEYNKPTGLDLTNSYCIDTMYSIKDFAFSTDYPFLPQIIPSTTKIYTKNTNFNYTKINDNTNEQKIDSIHFYTSKIEIKTETNLDPGVLKVQIHLTNGDVITLNMDKQSKDTIITANNLSIDVVNKETTIPVDIILTGNGSAQMTTSSFVKIQITPQYDNSQYVAYGTFKYIKAVTQTATYPINLNKYLPDSCSIYPVNPRIKFNVSSNLGIPIDLKISSLTTKQTKPLTIKSAHFATGDSTSILINRAYTVGSTASTSFTFDGDDNNGNLDNLFKIRVDTASLNFGFKVNQTAAGSTKQFIKSDSKVKLKASVTMPVWLAEGSQLAYNDTVKNIDKDLSDILDNATEAVIRLNNTNNLPFKINVKVKMLDENFKLITATNIYAYDVNAASTDANGSVTKATESSFYIRYNAATIADLKKAKHMLIETVGNNTGNKMLIKTTNGIKIKMGAYATSTGINIK